MKSNSRIFLAAILAVAAICTLAFPAFAGCPDNDPTCKLIPPESREVRVSTSAGNLVFSEVDSSNPLAPIPMPPPALLQPVTPALDPTSLTPEFTTIALPLRYQDPLDVSCGVQALGMALDGLERAEPVEERVAAPTSTALIAFLHDQGMMYDFGTGVEELALAAQEFGFTGSVSFHNWTLENLHTELAAGRPVVIDMGANGPDEPGHFVALTGLSPDGSWVAYSDPLLGDRVVSIEDFLGLWTLQGNSGVAVAEAPPTPLSPNYAPWTALAAAMMAALALAPSVLSDVRRKGVGGMFIAEAGSGGVTTYIGMDPPYSAPEGMKWVKGEAVYETHTRTEIVYHEVPKKELRKVQVGTTTQKIPYTKRILVDNGHWVTDYKYERYIKGYRYKRILDGYRTKRYVKYYRTRLYRNSWGFSRRRIPVYGYKRVPVYRTLRVPIYGTRKVHNGRHWESKWEYEVYTEYKTVVKPVYEEQWVTVGYHRIPEEKIIEEQIPVGYQWALERSRDPLPIKQEIDIIDEMHNIHTSIPHPKLMVTTAPLRIRSSPGTESASLTIAIDGADIIWTGNSQVIDTGATWYQVRYYDPSKGLVTGWVHSGYLETPVRIPDTATEVESSVNTSRTDAIGRWLHYFSPEERAAYIALEKQRLEAFWSEIRKLTIPQGGSGGGIEGLFTHDKVDIQFKPPEWCINGGMPDSFYKQHLLDEETLRMLQAILMKPQSLFGEVTDRTWEIISNALHINQEDLKVHVLGNVSWKPETMTSVGSYPITLYVIRPHGYYLLKNPSPGSGNISAAFLGVPGGEAVHWDGHYQLGVDDGGNNVVYYRVSWVFNGKTYLGWIPNEYLAPEVKHWDPSGGIPGEFSSPTFGYGDLADGWLKHHAPGAAQNLYLRAMLKTMGYSEEIYNKYPIVHNNLCGPLAVMEYFNVSLEEGIRRWIEFNEKMALTLQSGGTTSGGNLLDFFQAFDIEVEKTSGARQLITASNTRQPIVALVAISGGTVSTEGDTAHWIRVKEVEPGEMVEFFNPFTNDYETVSWDTFLASWDQASNTNNNGDIYRRLVTTKVD